MDSAIEKALLVMYGDMRRRQDSNAFHIHNTLKLSFTGLMTMAWQDKCILGS